MARTTKKPARAKAIEVIQIRTTEADKNKWKALAAIYAKGNMTLFIEYCVNAAPRKFLFPVTRAGRTKKPAD